MFAEGTIATITHAVRKSLKGNAARTVKRLGPDASLPVIMKKMEDVYGTVVDAGETLLAEFYGARQGKEEDVTAWGCRLEDLLDRAQEHGCVPQENMNSMLRSRFWNGLHQRLKDGSRHKYDTLTDFDDLRKAIRAIEREHQLTDESEQTSKKAQVKMTTASSAAGVSEDVAFKKLETAVNHLAKQLEVMQQQTTKSPEPMMVQQSSGWQAGRGPAHMGGSGQQGQPVRQNRAAPQGSSAVPTVGTSQPSPGMMLPQQVPQQQYNPHAPAFAPQVMGGGPVSAGNQQQGCFKCGEFGHFKVDCPRRFEPTCWKCGGLGHRQNSCRQLNFQNPLSRGGR